MDWITIQRVAELTGYSVNALRHKINRGQLVEEQHWRKARDGRILFHVENFNAWLKQ